MSKPVTLDPAGFMRKIVVGPDELVSPTTPQDHLFVLAHFGVPRIDVASWRLEIGGLLDILAITKQALSAPLRQLAELKLISHEPDGEDRRVKRLRLTTGGESLEAELTVAQMRFLSVAFERAGAANEAGWTKVMEILAKR